MRRTYRKDNFKELNRQIIIIGLIFILSVILGTYLNKMWPNYQNNIIDNVNPSIEYYNDSSIGLKDTTMINLKSDVIFMAKISILSILVVTFPLAIGVVILKGLSIGYTINSIILTLKFKSIKMVLITFMKNIIIVPGAIILLIISFNYFKEVIYELKKGKKDNILFLLKRYLVNAVIVLAITVGLQLLLNTVSVSIIKFLVR
ncbi:MAG: stage II sporulation protein M [Peptostreptococcaceae bacterium]